MSTTKRVFSGKTVEMLTIAEMMVAEAIVHKTPLQNTIEAWADPYFEQLEERVKKTFINYFGNDAGKSFRTATRILLEMRKNVLEDLSFLKVAIEERFKKDKPFITHTLKILGYSDFFRLAQTHSQESFVQLLGQFKHNMTDDLKVKIEASGAKKDLIESIMVKAEEVHSANITKEVFKGIPEATSPDALIQFNAIYEEVISISKVASKIFKNSPTLKNKFSYGKNLKALSGTPNKSNLAKRANALLLI